MRPARRGGRRRGHSRDGEVDHESAAKRRLTCQTGEMSSPMTPAEARVNLSAIRDNLALLKSYAPGAEAMAAVKADAYGHGMVAGARACLEGGADRLGTAYVREALELRAAGITAPIMSWIIPPNEP